MKTWGVILNLVPLAVYSIEANRFVWEDSYVEFLDEDSDVVAAFNASMVQSVELKEEKPSGEEPEA